MFKKTPHTTKNGFKTLSGKVIYETKPNPRAALEMNYNNEKVLHFRN